MIERTFDAPVDMVWAMWTDPRHFRSWYGPMGATVPVADLDVRVGGRRLVSMEVPTPDGVMTMWFTGEYREVDDRRAARLHRECLRCSGPRALPRRDGHARRPPDRDGGRRRTRGPRRPDEDGDDTPRCGPRLGRRHGLVDGDRCTRGVSRRPRSHGMTQATMSDQKAATSVANAIADAAGRNDAEMASSCIRR